ncbi:MAG: ATP-binding cassette domain-containing protein [Eubacteriales bacterium]
MSEEYALELSNITKTFPGVKALDHVSFGVKKGRFVFFVGENGAGKSTLMKVINGMHKANEGTVAVHGKVENITSPGMAEKLGNRHDLSGTGLCAGA